MAVAVLIVVPDVDHCVISARDGGQPIDDSGAMRTQEVGRYHLGRLDVVNLLAEPRVQRGIAQVRVEPLAIHGLAQREVEDGHGHVWGGNANGIARELSLKFRDCLGYGFGRSRFREDHIEGGRPSPSISLVEVVDEVLVVRVGVHCFDVTVLDAVLLVDDLQNWGNRIRRTRRGRDDVILSCNGVVVNAVDDVLE